MVRGEVRAWYNQRFSRGHSGMINLDRGDPQYTAGRASPTLSHDPVNYAVYGPGASNEVWKTDAALENVTIVATDAIVSSRLAVTLDDEYVAFGTQSGALHLAWAKDLTLHWTTLEMNPIKGDLAVDDTHIFVGDDQGNGVGQIVAWEMAYVVQPPSPLPTAVPTQAPSPSPAIGSALTSVPTAAPTRVNNLATTEAPTPPTTTAPAKTTQAPSRSSNVEASAAVRHGSLYVGVVVVVVALHAIGLW